jgi:hypothetical protein
VDDICAGGIDTSDWETKTETYISSVSLMLATTVGGGGFHELIGDCDGGTQVEPFGEAVV